MEKPPKLTKTRSDWTGRTLSHSVSTSKTPCAVLIVITAGCVGYEDMTDGTVAVLIFQPGMISDFDDLPLIMSLPTKENPCESPQ